MMHYPVSVLLARLPSFFFFFIKGAKKTEPQQSGLL